MRPSHLRSLSQPPFLSFDSLPPLSPSTADVSMVEVGSHSQGILRSPSLPKGNQFLSGLSLPPSKGHRDIPLGFSDMIQSSPQLIPISGNGVLGRDNLVKDDLVWSVKQELQSDGDCAKHGEGKGERKSEGKVADDLLNSYVNLDKMDTLNSTGIEDKDMDSRASGTKTNGADSDNEVESRRRKNPNSMNGVTVNFPNEKRVGVKRSAGGDGPLAARHFRSVSMDSFMENLKFSVESPKLPPPPSLGAQAGQNLPSNLEFGNGEFSGAELKKIMASEKLAEIAMSDPKRAKRILANRQSAAFSKERKVRYIAELEQKVQTLQSEAATLSAQLTLLQRDSAGLTSQNNELRFRIQAMEQQAQLKDVLNEALTAEVQRLKLTTANPRGEAKPYSNNMSQQISMNQMF